jgi:hypothetical protein
MSDETSGRQAGDPFDVRHAEISALTERLGADHPRTLQKRLMLAREFLQRGRSDDALNESVSIRSDLNQAGQRYANREVAVLRRMLVDSFLQLGQLQEATAEQEVVTSLHLQMFGAENIRHIGSRANLATMLLRGGDPRRAATEAGRALTSAVQILGPDHVITMASRTTLADADARLREDR